MTEPRHYLQFPTCHSRQLAFVSEDDLWLCDLNGMHTRRVTTDFGTVKNPQFSPDGQKIAFSSDREGSIEAYVVSVNGGNPTKLTYTGAACLVVAWADNDTVIVASAHQSPFRQGMLYKVPATAGSLEVVAVGPANAISYSPDQSGMVIQRHGYGYPSWKRYQGGTAAELWLKRDSKQPFSLFCKKQMNMIQPVWYQDRIYFISDFQGHGNVYSADLDGGSLRRHTQCEGFYVRQFCIDHDMIIYSQQGQLYQVPIDLTTSSPLPAKHLAIDTGSICHHKTRRYDFSSKTLEDIAPNHNASSVALCHRGRLFAMPSFQGPARLLDHNQQQRYRHCLWLQKTGRVFAICDDGNMDYPALFDTEQPDETAKRWQSVNLGKVLCLMASPVEDRVLIANNRHELHVFDLKSGKLTKVAHSAFGTISQFDWSSDGQWVAYRTQNSHETAQIMLYHVAKAEQTALTNGLYHDYSPCFDPDGKYLYFLSHRSLTPKGDGLCFQYNFSDTTLAYVCCLQSDTTDPFYHQAKTEEDEKSDDNADAKKAEDDKKSSKDDQPKPVSIDLEGISTRVLPFPVEPSSTTKLLALSGKVLFITASWADDAADGAHDDSAGSVSVYDFKELKFDHLFDGITGAQLSHDRGFLCYSNPSKQIRIIPAGAKPDEKDTSFRKGGLIDHQRARVAITPATEWPFMLKEAWRLQRDFFWDRDMANVDWDAILARYLSVAERVTTRAELTDLIGELHGELGSSHAYIMGGDLPSKRHYRQGLLGAETTYDQSEKAYRITDICDAQDISSTSLISPVSVPGVALAVGDFITAVNGVSLTDQLTPECALEQQAGQYVQLSVRRANSKSKKKSAKAKHSSESVIIQAGDSNHDRVYRAWVEKNRAYVHAKSNGKLGYIHIPDMSKDGYAEFLRSFLPSFDCDGLVVDVRFNGGGHVSSLILQKLALKRFGLDKTRWHEANLCYPANAPKGCMVGLCNEYAGSDGDMFSYAFKKMQLGTLVGKRTWGGVIGINVRHALLDGGVTTQPEYAIWLEGVGYGVENHGVDPDEVVEITPEQAASDQDPQLDRAIAIAMEELKTARYADLDQQLADTKIPSRQAPKLPDTALIEA